MPVLGSRIFGILKISLPFKVAMYKITNIDELASI